MDIYKRTNTCLTLICAYTYTYLLRDDVYPCRERDSPPRSNKDLRHVDFVSTQKCISPIPPSPHYFTLHRIPRDSRLSFAICTYICMRIVWIEQDQEQQHLRYFHLTLVQLPPFSLCIASPIPSWVFGMKKKKDRWGSILR